MPQLSAANQAQLQKLQRQWDAQVSSDKPAPTHRQVLLTILKQANEAADWGNPVRAGQHIKRAIRYVEDNVK